MFGVINIDKPLHCTSHDVVAKVRRKLGIKKVGHGGTLDPLASGVLPVCVGQATRLLEYFPSDKRYRAQITLGKTTLTWDAEGEVLSQHSAEGISKKQVEEALAQFEGRIQQQVPPHSAVHVQGKKLYEYARKGIAVTLPVRETEIYEAQLVFMVDEGKPHPVVELEIHCASGTYIRSIAKALGEVLGCGAYLSGLIRTQHGHFGLETSVSLEAFMASADPAQYLLDPLPYLPFGQVSLDEAAYGRVMHGNKTLLTGLEMPIKHQQRYVLMFEGQPVAIAVGEACGQLKPLKVFAGLL